MTSAVFTVLLIAAVLATAFVTSGVFDFHKSDAAGQGLAKAFTMFADIALLLVLAALMLMCGVRGAFPGAWGILAAVLYLVAAASLFGSVFVLSDLASGDRYEVLLRLLVPAVPILLIVYAGMHYYASAPSSGAKLAVAISLLILSAVSLATLAPAKSGSDARRQAVGIAFEEARQRDLARAAEAAALPPDTPVVDFLRYIEIVAYDSQAKRAAMQRIKQHSGRQAQIESALDQLDFRFLPLLADLELTVTPQFCESARKCLRQSNERYRPTADSPTFAAIEDRLNWFTITTRWLLEQGCNCKEEIAGLQKIVEQYPDPYPKTFFVNYLVELQGKAIQ